MNYAESVGNTDVPAVCLYEISACAPAKSMLQVQRLDPLSANLSFVIDPQMQSQTPNRHLNAHRHSRLKSDGVHPPEGVNVVKSLSFSLSE